jgi:beta-N-acetylhexosaminidase
VSSLERLADAVLLPGFAGTTAPDWVRRRVAGGLGGVVLFARNCASVEQIAALTAALRAERAGVVVATDEEGGDVTRLDAAVGSPVPGAYALGVVDDVALTRAVSAAVAARLAAAGVTLNLAPVADVNSAPDNPVIGVRSFGASPALVARHVAAAVAGTQDAGVAACAKHFPGHGDTTVDSHVGLPTVRELVLDPFRAAVEAGVAAVMTGHLLVPGHGSLPATLNPELVTGLLRGSLGFRGTVVSDALEMGAIAGTVGLAEGAVLALVAGVDALCLGGEEAGDEQADAVRDALVAAVRAGRLPESRLAEAAARTAALAAPPAARAELGPAEPGLAELGVAELGLAELGLAELGLAAARRAVRVVGDVRLPGPPALVVLDPTPTVAVGRTAWGLAGLLPGAVEWRLGPTDPVPALPAERPTVVVARDAARVGWVGRAVTALLAARPDAIVVEMGLPGPAPPGARGWIATGGASRAGAFAAAELLLGVDHPSPGGYATAPPREAETASAPPHEAETTTAPPHEAETTTASAREAETASAPAGKAEIASAPAGGAETTTASAREAEVASAPAGGAETASAPAGGAEAQSARGGASSPRSGRREPTSTVESRGWGREAG